MKGKRKGEEKRKGKRKGKGGKIPLALSHECTERFFCRRPHLCDFDAGLDFGRGLGTSAA